MVEIQSLLEYGDMRGRPVTRINGLTFDPHIVCACLALNLETVEHFEVY